MLISEEAALERFAHFNDALLKSVIILFADDGSKMLKTRVTCRDWLRGNDVWVEVEILMRGLHEYRLGEKPGTTVQVLSNGIHLLRLPNRIALDFGDLVDQPLNLEELIESNYFAICDTLEFFAD